MGHSRRLGKSGSGTPVLMEMRSQRQEPRGWHSWEDLGNLGDLEDLKDLKDLNSLKDVKDLKILKDLKDFGKNLVFLARFSNRSPELLRKAFYLLFFKESPDDFSVSIFLV